MRSWFNTSNDGLKTSFILGLFTALFFSASAQAQLSQVDAATGLRGALTQGANVAISKLGVDGGFLNNPTVKIPLPDTLRKAEKMLKLAGLGKQSDELVLKMNHAAEAAVPLAKPLLIDAIKSMTVADAKGIISGGNDSVTQFFKAKTQASLKTALLPIVKQSTDKVGLAQQYNGFAAKLQPMGLIKGDAANIEGYVTGKTLDGLYTMIAQEERDIRANPMQAASSVVQAVFGALRK
jgi:hypothetical protein